MKSRLFLLKAELDKNASEELKSKYIRTSDARNYNLAFVDVIKWTNPRRLGEQI